MPQSSDLCILYARTNTLNAHPHNARIHSKAQIRKIAASIKSFGFTNPILLDGSDTILAGHGRLAAAKLLGMDQVPTIRLDSLTPDQIRAYVIADNKLAEEAGWDRSLLAIELQHLMSIEDGLDIEITGFETAEIDIILGEYARKSKPVDDITQDEIGPPVTKTGDLWHLGKHRLLCGSALDISSFARLMEGRRADCVFIDPPYNVRIDGHATGNGAIKHREFAMASGELNSPEFIEFLSHSLRWAVRYSRPGSIHYICMDWRHFYELTSAGKDIYDSLLNVCVWVKNIGGMGSFYRSRHECVFVYRNGKGSHRNNVQLGRFGRDRTNVWEYPGVTSSRHGEEGDLLALHPTVKPIAMVADALLDCSARGEFVLDSFLGSGTTLMAAERVGRVCYGMEIDPLYIDTAIRRWQRYTGEKAIDAATGERFDALAARAATEVTRG